MLSQAGLYADRLSVNIELPTISDLEQLAPQKNRTQLERNMAEVYNKAIELKDDKKKGMKVPLFNPAGQSTQMIVGATPTPDREILNTSSTLYNKYKLRRVYYSAFSPIPHADKRLPGISPPLMREHRLYQADWLLRFYGFSVEEITPDAHPELPIDIDPKTAWALRNPGFFPIDVNIATKEMLLRIPGVGVNSVLKILSIRRYQKLSFHDLVRLRIPMNRAKLFIITSDYSPNTQLLDSPKLGLILKPEAQLQLFD